MSIWAFRDAKIRFDELLHAAESEPQIVTYRGLKYEFRAVARSQQAPAMPATPSRRVRPKQDPLTE